jgi:DUF4097 and DUF4098 domain-containing protein YvlB
MNRYWNRTIIIFIFAAALAISSIPAFAAAQGDFSRTLKVSGPVNLEITTGSGNIDVRTGSSDQVQITGHIKASNWFAGNSSAEERVKRLQANPPIQQSGNDIRVGHIDDPELRRNISISYELVVPAQTQLHSNTGSGDQDIQGVSGMVEANAGSGGLKISNIGNTVRAETGSGDIELDGIKGNVRVRAGSGTIRGRQIGGGFEADSGSGHITLEQTAPGSVRADTGSGGMELHGVRGSLEAKAGSGDIRADGDPTGGWTVHTGSGDVELRLAQTASFDVNARTSSGSISIDQPVTMQGSLGRKHIQGKVRGGGVPVEVETGSGDIRIE